MSRRSINSEQLTGQDPLGRYGQSMHRLALPVIAVASLTLALSGCAGASAGGSSAAACEPTADGPETALLAVIGGFGTGIMVQDISSEYLKVTSTERHVSIEGDSAPAALAGQTVTAHYTMFNGATGDEIITSVPGTEAFKLDTAVTPVGVVKALTCATPNTRIVAIIPASEGFKEAPVGFPTGVPLLLIADVTAVG